MWRIAPTGKVFKISEVFMYLKGFKVVKIFIAFNESLELLKIFENFNDSQELLKEC